MSSEHFDFFVSYNSAQTDWVKDLTCALRDSGCEVFFANDSISPGEDIISRIGYGLARSATLLVVLSNDSTASRWVELEWATALHQRTQKSTLKIIPIIHSKCEIPLVLAGIKAIDAKGLDGTACAAQLLHQLGQRDTTPRQMNWGRYAPLGKIIQPYSSFYIKRSTDGVVAQHLDAKRPLFLYGPRRIGKTSVLHREKARAVLSGVPTVYIDMSLTHGADEERLFAQVGHTIAANLGRSERYMPRRARIGYGLVDLLHEIDQLQEGGVILFFDEFHVGREYPERFYYFLRYVQAEFAERIQLVCSGFFSPLNVESAGVHSSPWYTDMEIVKLSYCSEIELEEMWRKAFLPSPETVGFIYEMTGGHPEMILRIIKDCGAIDAPHKLSEEMLLEDSWLRSIVEMPVETARRFLGDRFQAVIRDLLEQGTIKDTGDRDFLADIGLIRKEATGEIRVPGWMLERSLRSSTVL